MTNQEQQKKMAEKNFRFNRFLFLRYVLAVFFFANLYWLLAAIASNALLLILPLSLLVLAILAIGEYVRLYGSYSEQIAGKLRWTRLFYLCQLTMNLLLYVVCFFSPLFSFVFPFLDNTLVNRGVLALWLGVGLALAALCLQRVNKIRRKKDTYYGYIKEYKKLIEGK
ncbi:MAG: hypothetical protein E7152_08100 [Enterococcus casseliflavus]|uniref:hypothetical protein n=1 Tax=Enterococcus sp. RIT-PI-f TaxID=1690244 RepID=UPI003561F33B|nr:hypothetical protein [Enterococcus casseliflavus]